VSDPSAVAAALGFDRETSAVGTPSGGRNGVLVSAARLAADVAGAADGVAGGTPLTNAKPHSAWHQRDADHLETPA